MSASYPTKIILALASGNVCALCNTSLTVPSDESSGAEILGQAAHIYGEGGHAARYDSTKSADFVDSEKNLIYLCPNCHAKIDKQDSSYSVEELQRIKTAHEERIRVAVEISTISINYEHVAFLCKALVNNWTDSYDSSLPTSPKEKISRNLLSAKVEDEIVLGLSKATEIRNFLESQETVVPGFGDRVKDTLTIKYNDFKSRHLASDYIFSALVHYVALGSSDSKNLATANALISYFFESCDIFEK